MTLRGSEFTQNRMDVTEVANTAGAALDRALSSVFAEKAFEQNFEDHQMEIALNQGQLSLGQINRIINDARVTSDIRDEQAAKSRDSTNTMMFIALLDQLQAQAEWHGEQARGYEQGFEEDYGEDWREDMALAILDPELVVRRDGESLEDYHARLEQELIDEMLNPDGSIKDEYKDHPEYGDWAKWAQHRHMQKGYEARVAKIDTAETYEETLEAAEEAVEFTSTDETIGIIAETRNHGHKEAVAEVAVAHYDEQRDTIFDEEAEATDVGFSLRP